MTATVRRTFEASIQALKDDVVELGDRVETALLASVNALKERDLERSRRLIAQERRRRALADMHGMGWPGPGTGGPGQTDAAGG